jgi:hypothetical protein
MTTTINRLSKSAPAFTAPIHLGPFTLTLAFNDGRFTGIGEVLFEETSLRCPSLPWTFYTESEQGIRFSPDKVLDVHCSDDSVVLRFLAKGQWLPRIQEADAMGDARVRTRRIVQPTAEFRWTFRTIKEKIWDNEWSGLSMQLEVSSKGHPLHWIIEDTTWEIGGEAEGCTLIQQDISTMDLEQTVRRNSAFSTIERFFTEGWGGAFPMDMLPRAAGAAICDFQAKGDLALCLFSERPSLTRARLEKFADENVIHYLDRPFFRLSENARPPERKLLVYRHPAKLKRHEWRNLWLDCFTEVRRRILQPFDFTPEIPLPFVHAHLWDDDLKKLGAAWYDDMRDAMPDYRKLGFRQSFVHGVWDSITSDPNPAESGNICCPYNFEFAEQFGGAAAMKRLTDAAAKNDISIYQWYSFHLSRHAEIWKLHPEWVLREANGDPWDASYHTLWSGRFLGPFGEWMRNQVKTSCVTAGLKGIFWDSYQNLGVTCIDWGAPDKAPQAEEIWRFQGELQKMGIGQRCEIITVFGVSAVAVYGFKDDKFRRRLWSHSVTNDDVFALLDTSPGFFSEHNPFGPDGVNPDLYFWLVAHRVVPGMSAHPWKNAPSSDKTHGVSFAPGGALAEEYAAVNRIYLEALPRMHRLRLTEDASHTLWLDEEGKPAVIWALKKGEIDHRGDARELCSGEKRICTGKLPFKRGEVWLIEVHS